MKTCTVCGLTPPVDPYKSIPQRCRSCHLSEVSKDRRANPEKHSAREKARYVGKRREKILADASARALVGGPKRKAHIAVGNAVRDGRMDKPDCCSVCARSGVRIEGHHNDYTKPLDVVWMCARCHRRFHADNPQIEN